MRIISQDGCSDIPYDEVALSIGMKADKSEYHILCHPQAKGDYGRIATYSTEEKSKKALEMLHSEYKKVTLYLLSDKSDFIPPKIFQFPADKEIEV